MKWLLSFTTFILLALSSYNSNAQAKKQTQTQIKDTVRPPQFPGGNDSLTRYLQRNIYYPEAAKENDVKGEVTVRFVINNQGKITQPVIMKSIGGGCDEQVLRMLQRMPDWAPATYNGNPVMSVYMLPVIFRLE